MAQKESSRVFAHGDEVKNLVRGSNKRVENWIARNWQRCEGLTGPIHKSSVSDVLRGNNVVEPVANAMDIMFQEMLEDPWVWCEPPTLVEDLSDYAPLAWWYQVLNPPIPFSTFERMGSNPLKAAQREVTQTRLDAWVSRLRAACDQYSADQALVRALRADMNPTYQYWVVEDSGPRLVSGEREMRLGPKGFKRRAGNPGLHGRTPEEIGVAYALADADLPMPLVGKACLAYERPRAAPIHDHPSVPVEPWNGLEFEGVERNQWEDKCDLGLRFEVEHRVLYYWDGQQYRVADFDWSSRFARVRQDGGEWRAPTPKEEVLMKLEVDRQHETTDELLARRDQWIADTWASKKADWEGEGLGGIMQRQNQPDGVPESEAVAAFEAHLERTCLSQDVRDEQDLLARRRIEFMRKLRRRPA